MKKTVTTQFKLLPPGRTEENDEKIYPESGTLDSLVFSGKRSIMFNTEQATSVGISVMRRTF